MATLLVVEHAPPLRHVLARALRARQHTVFTCPDAQSALDFIQLLPRPLPLDALITELHLPDMEGSLLALKVGRPTILTSGRYPTDLGRVQRWSSRSIFLAKPFSIHTLELQLTELLDPATTQSEPLQHEA